ncbi:MAG TPA: molybdate ABC transporter substrate-binding protein [Pyrinomonadaceae bacterium]|jgi:molybdate transport system substrate-binding protein
MSASTLFKLCAGFAMAALLLAACGSSEMSDETNPKVLYVAAAADLTPAFEEIGRNFEQATGIRVVYNFGSTGMLAKQIENGAPVDVFAAANVEFIDGLEQKGLIIPDSKALYARGRITIWLKRESALRIERLEDLARPEVERVAIANPEHAPYGVAAREALQAARVWDVVQPKCVFGENVRQTLQYAESGNVSASIVALSLSVQSNGRWILVPEELHKPLDQALAVMKRTRREQQARQFVAFINGEQGRPVMRRYGFLLPGEPVARQ